MNALVDNLYIFRYLGRIFTNCGGATGGQAASLGSDQAFQKTMLGDYNTEFGENQALMNNLTRNLQTTINAGVGQQGFAAPELASMNSQNINAAAASNAKLQTAIGENAAGKSTADPGVESGVLQAEKAAAATQVDTSMNNTAANITQANYNTGRQNYWSAVKGQEEAPSAFETPLSQTASAVNNSNSITGSQANAIQQADQEGIDSTLGLVTGLAGDAAGGFAKS